MAQSCQTSDGGTVKKQEERWNEKTDQWDCTQLIHNQCDREWWARQVNKQIRIKRTIKFNLWWHRENATQQGLHVGGHAWLCMSTFDARVPKRRLLVATFILRLVSLNLLCHSGTNTLYSVAAFTSADICYVVVLAANKHKSALQLLISSSGPFAMLPALLHWHTALWWTVCYCQPRGQLMNLALNQRTAISLLWLDGQVLEDV